MGLLFLYFGFKAVMPMLDLEIIEDPDKTDIINGLMPVVFNLAVGWWLLGGRLARWAYPEPKAPAPGRLREQPQPEPTPTQSPQLPPELTGMDRAEQKLASLVDKPGDRGA